MASGKAKGREGPEGAYCSLCERFAAASNSFSCEGCPVREKTGRSSCSGTPYSYAYYAYCTHGMDSKQFKSAAKVELKFLKSLLPRKKRKAKGK